MMRAIENCNLRSRRRAFTLVELLVVITIIAMLAGISLGALAKTREKAKLDATKETVAKINDLVTRRYESYRTRRINIQLPPISASFSPANAATLRVQAIRDLMRMEMPDRWTDIAASAGTMAGPTGSWDSSRTLPGGLTIRALPSPSLQRVYFNKYKNPGTFGMSAPTADHQQAKCLYLWVTTTFPEAKSLFRAEEISNNVDGDHWPCFVDGWGNPIGFLRWAPGTTSWSDIQIDDTASANLHHDPFDPLNTQPNAYQLYPLIFAGVLGKISGVDDYGIALGNGQLTGDANITAPTVDPYSAPYNSTSNPPYAVGAVIPNGGVPLVTNHHIEAR